MTEQDRIEKRFEATRRREGNCMSCTNRDHATGLVDGRQFCSIGMGRTHPDCTTDGLHGQYEFDADVMPRFHDQPQGTGNG